MSIETVHFVGVKSRRNSLNWIIATKSSSMSSVMSLQESASNVGKNIS